MDEDEAAPQPSNLPAGATWSVTQWHWSKRSKDKWRRAPRDWQKFMNYWMESSRALELNRTEFPHALTIFPSPPFSFGDMEVLGATSLDFTSQGTILVFERYAFLYHGINRWQRENTKDGVIVAGQPGIGKSLFLWYLLVRLIHDRQPVLLHLPHRAGSTPSILFYRGHVWRPKDKDYEFLYLPHEAATEELDTMTHTIMLVDSSEEVKAPRGLTHASGWPIYAVSPKKERYHEFRKVRNATLWGLDLWSPAHLRKGLELQIKWPRMMKFLTAYLASPESMQDIPNRLEKAIATKESAKYATWPKETATDWIDILLDDAIYQYGLVPRSVFQHVLSPVITEQRAALPSDILKRIENQFPVYGSSTSDAIYDEIVALRVQPHSLTCIDSTEFSVVIGSAAVWEQLQHSLSKTAPTQIEETFHSLRAVSRDLNEGPLGCGSWSWLHAGPAAVFMTAATDDVHDGADLDDSQMTTTEMGRRRGWGEDDDGRTRWTDAMDGRCMGWRRSDTSLRSLAVSSGAVLAGHIFAAYALNRMKQDNPPLPLKPMTLNPFSDSAEPLFISDLEEMRDADMKDVEMEDAEAKDLASRPAVQFMPTRGRSVQAWSERTYKLGQPNSLLARGHVIFVAVATNHPLFDAFFLDVPDGANQLFRVLWVIQFTTRRNHKCSSKGFLDVRRLMKQAGISI
ncbi:hypothetical protein BDZ89DRAFT_1155428 [Hymenopellis radicata]|nr:hypothetical protein BDZ89DRAFT_1155428 [Hymenopellis radicata]